MGAKVFYEWDYETVNEDRDIEDHNHADKLSGFNDSDKTDTLVLVRNEVDDEESLSERYWAYVKEGVLPEYFSGSMGTAVGIRVPKRFNDELKSYLKKEALATGKKQHTIKIKLPKGKLYHEAFFYLTCGYDPHFVAECETRKWLINEIGEGKTIALSAEQHRVLVGYVEDAVDIKNEHIVDGNKHGGEWTSLMQYHLVRFYNKLKKITDGKQ